MNIETENDSIYLFNQKNNYGELNTEISTKNNYFSDPISKIPYFNTNNYDETHNTYHLSTLSKKKSYINNSIRKKNILLMFKPIIKPFKEIEYLNIKKIRIKKDIIPILTNNNIGIEILKNKSSIFNNKTKINLFKSKSLNNYHIRNLNLNKNISYNLNFFKDYEKEFFPNVDYSNLEYNEYNIYKDKAAYEKLIKEKIEYFKNNKNKNYTVKFEKKLNYGKNKKEFNLVFNSLQLSFKDMSLHDNVQNKELLIDFPFSLLPIFYYRGFEAFIKFLSVVLKIENNFEKIYLDEEKIKDALNDLQVYSIEKEEDKNNEFGLKYSFIKTEKIIHLRSPIIDRNKNDLRFNYFIFFWITNLKTFIVKITLPCIHLNIINHKLQINHFIDFELLFFLYKRNFLNWEYFLIKYLSNYSTFRNIIRKIDFSTKIYEKTIFLKEPRTKINSFSEENLINVYTDQFNNNRIVHFKSFYVIVKFQDLISQQEKTYYIYFNFYQYIKLYELSKYTSKVFFLSNFLEINNDIHSIKFNFDEYENFDIKTWIENLKKFSEINHEHKDINDDLYSEFDFFSKRIHIEFRRPRWTIISFENQNEISKTWEIGKELEKEFIESIVDSSSDSWTNLLNGILKKLNEPVPEVAKKNIKKKTKKKGSRSRTNSASSTKRDKSRAKSNFSKDT